MLTKGAGKAKLDVHFAGAAKGEAVRDFEIIDNHDYSYTVKYTAVQQVCPTPAPPHLSWLTGSASPSSSLLGPLLSVGPFPAAPPLWPCPSEPQVHLGHGHVARLCLSHPVPTSSCTQQGNMAVTVTYGGDPVPKSPFVVNVAPPLDLSKVKVQGLNSSKWGRS